MKAAFNNCLWHVRVGEEQQVHSQSLHIQLRCPCAELNIPVVVRHALSHAKGLILPVQAAESTKRVKPSDKASPKPSTNRRPHDPNAYLSLRHPWWQIISCNDWHK